MRIIQTLVLFAAVAALGGAQSQVIDFEDRPVGFVTAEYSSRGVIFDRAYVDQHPNAHSGSRVLRSIAPNVEAFTPAPLRMTLPSAARFLRCSLGSAISGR